MKVRFSPTARARAIADAATLLFPGAMEAWRCLSEVAGRAGDAEAVEACGRELAALGESPVPFAIPGVARA